MNYPGREDHKSDGLTRTGKEKQEGDKDGDRQRYNTRG
jgi:hypothetical protein